MTIRGAYIVGLLCAALAVTGSAIHLDWPRVAAFAVGISLAALVGSLVYVYVTNPRKGAK